MDSQAAALLSAQGGVIGAPQLRRLGIGSLEVQTWVADSRLRRVRRGAFVEEERWQSADADERYRLTTIAVMRSRSTDESASHQSALALHRLPLWHVDRSLVVLTSDIEQSITRSGLRLMPLRGLAAIDEVEGLPALTVPDALVTTASVSVEAGVVAADAALHDGSCTLEGLAESAERLGPGLRGKARLRRAIAAVDGAAESPGESRTRLVLNALGLPVESQVTIRDALGEFVGRVDLVVAGRVVVEFDGAVKYRGDDGPDVLFAEKVREDRLRELGYEVVRVTWRDLADPAKLMARVRAALLRRAA